jgi:hypothetical protein
MEVLDVNGKQICRGLRVKYVRTHTIGKVTRILIKEDGTWAKLDSNDLYYKSDYIEVIEGNEIYVKSKRKKNSKSDEFEVKTPIEISDLADGPGYGGG